MTASDLVKSQSDSTAAKVEKVLDRIGEAGADHRANPEMMSAREIVEHFCECYLALEAHLDGQNHRWGSYTDHPSGWTDGLARYRDYRNRAVSRALAVGSPEALDLISDYVILHDCYHLGQLASTKLSLDPSWNSHELYG